MGTDSTVRARWVASLYPDAGEAGGSLQYPVRRRPSFGPGDPERAKAEAGRRARTKVRRYCAANRLNRLGTLTYAGKGCHDPKQARADAGEFFRALRAELGGEALPYLWVPEWHPGGHGLHLHFAVGRYIKRSAIERAWGRGFVHIKLLGDLPTGSGRLEEARLAARYLGKYVTKDADQGWEGLHRYEVAQGFQPARVSIIASTGRDTIAQLAEQMARPPDYVWWSSETQDWQGPPAVWVSWAA
ncbi:hypothetical protein ACFUC1_17390 [Pedococcus sp. NPDC057267]|uniref:rolling circle replication-associated protein n=1 Tax=Pedococcus sp. NPDC057267 TaxID=3346077 RepID=UPI00364391FA